MQMWKLHVIESPMYGVGWLSVGGELPGEVSGRKTKLQAYICVITIETVSFLHPSETAHRDKPGREAHKLNSMRCTCR